MIELGWTLPGLPGRYRGRRRVRLRPILRDPSCSKQAHDLDQALWAAAHFRFPLDRISRRIYSGSLSKLRAVNGWGAASRLLAGGVENRSFYGHPLRMTRAARLRLTQQGA